MHGWSRRSSVRIAAARPAPLPTNVKMTRSFLITQSAIRNRRNSIKTKVRHGF
jgi:hypothetical protein